MDCSMPGIPVHHQLPEFTQTHVHWAGDAIQPFHPCHPLLFPPSIFPSTRGFTNESTLHIRWPVSASASVLPTNTQDWFPLGWTGQILLQSKGVSRVFSNTTVQKHQFLRHSTSFIVQLSHQYMTTGKTTALTRQAFVSEVMSLLLNRL